MSQLFRVMRRFLVVSLKHVSVCRLQFRLHPVQAAGAQALVLANALKRSLMVTQVYLYPSAQEPTAGVIGVHCETSSRKFCAKIQLTSKICKNEAASTQHPFIHLVQFDSATCKTDSLRSFLRDIQHPPHLFSDGIDPSSQ